MSSENISTKFAIAVGFSNGCAELTLKKPPPFVPSCLMMTCDAAGPAIVWSFAVVTVGPNVWTTPCERRTTAPTSESGSRM